MNKVTEFIKDKFNWIATTVTALVIGYVTYLLESKNNKIQTLEQEKAHEVSEHIIQQHKEKLDEIQHQTDDIQKKFDADNADFEHNLEVLHNMGKRDGDK